MYYDSPVLQGTKTCGHSFGRACLEAWHLMSTRRKAACSFPATATGRDFGTLARGSKIVHDPSF